MTDKGNLIAELRREAGFTQKTLAEALHITDKAISKWERGLSLPDVSLLPKLSLLLGADLSLLLTPTDGKHPHEGWSGLIDLRECDIDLSRIVYDKPIVYFMLSHFLLLNITDITILCSEKNQEYLKSTFFIEMGFHFIFTLDGNNDKNLMILNRPCFLFGSDLTRQFQGAMVMESIVKLAPMNTMAPFLFCPAEYSVLYFRNPDYLYDIATVRTLGRGMICLDMDNIDNQMEVASFVQTYQKHTRLLIGSLEEIAFRKGTIDKVCLKKYCEKKSYGSVLLNMVDLPEG